MTGTSHEDLRIFMANISLNLFSMRNVTDVSCRENQSTHFRFRKGCLTIVSFMR